MQKETAPTQKKRAAKANYSAPALDKGLDILELLSTEGGGLTLSEVAQKLNRSVSEIFRMLAVLEQRHYLSFDAASERYCLTLKMFVLAHRHAPVKRLTAAALPVMQKMARELEQSCHLVIYYQSRGLVIAQTDSPAARNFSVRLGAAAPLLDTCSGHLLLAFAGDDERKDMLKAQQAAITGSINASALDKVIERVRRQGYESVTSTQIHGVHDIGYPVFDYSGRIVAALVVPFLEHLDGSHQISLEAARGILEKSALAVSTSLGYVPT
ncbi:MAG: IclR family transcriptional regulator [Gammaproteobacteria bacterium]|nr:IclR family transcriptional regulator [Gammaproteobacteria bacterium]MCY4210225.1 IclR family transcriptional regulator [Gammaproteobacteria bacterium]MCY4338154.1 IclR family transcriptional regulator [Gammaproteobacteria bacterium]